MLNRFFKMMLGVAVMTALGMAQTAAGPQCKDDQECTLYGNAGKETDPAKKIVILDQWTEKYPDTAFKDVRNYLYIDSYSRMAGAALAPSASPDVLASGEKAAHTVIDKADTMFAPEMKMKNVTDDQWKQAKSAVLLVAHRALAVSAQSKKDYTAAETEAKAIQQLDPADALSAYWLGTAIMGQKNVDRYPEAIFYLARSVSMGGKEALTPEMKKPADAYLTKVYSTYHGDGKGLDDVKKLAATATTPPPDYKVKSITEISKEQIGAEQAFLDAHPKIAQWRGIKATLTGDGGDKYFEENMKGAALTDLVGKVVAQPDSKTLTISIDDATPETAQVAEVTMLLDSPLKGEVPALTELTFSGTAKAYTKSPFMVTFDVEKGNVQGLGDAAGPATPVKKKAPAKAKKKAA